MKSFLHKKSLNAIMSLIIIGLAPLNTQSQESQSLVYYDMETCHALLDQVDMIYSEFDAFYPEPLACGSLNASILHREDPDIYKHSCTEGYDNTLAMCVSSLDNCDYIADSDEAVIVHLDLTPDAGFEVQLTEVSFYHKAPEEFSWINGASGPNNYPTLIGIRVLKNFEEVIAFDSIPTSNDWQLETFDFSSYADLAMDDWGMISIEILPYCLAGIDSEVTAWDIDDLNISAACKELSLNQNLRGMVTTVNNEPLSDIRIDLKGDETQLINNTNDDGQFLFENINSNLELELSAQKNTDWLNGVSTMDIVMIQQHILGLSAFEHSHQYIAADVNKSQSLTAIDLIELRKLILGVYDELPQNNSWLCFDAQDKANINLPFIRTENIQINNEIEFEDVHHFEAIKVGDVNGSAKANLAANTIQSRENKKTSWDFELINDGSGNSKIVLFAREALAIAGLQLNWSIPNSAIRTLNTITTQFDKSDYKINDKTLMVSWAPKAMQQINKGDILFEIVLENKVEEIFIDQNKNELVEDELYVGTTLEVYKPVLHQNFDIQNQSNWSLVSPNPFSQVLNIETNLEDDSTLELTLYDLKSSIVFNQKLNATKGNQVHKVEVNSNLKSGTYIMRCTSDFESSVHKIVKL